MTEPAGAAGSGRGAGSRPRATLSGAVTGVRVVDALLERGHFAEIDRHFAALVADLDGAGGPELTLAAALASAWTRDGHACVALSAVSGGDWPRPGGVRLPDLEAWVAVLDASPMVARPGDAERRPLVLDGRRRLYLERLWTAEQTVAADLLGLAVDAPPVPAGLVTALDRLFPDAASDDRAPMAARTAACRRLCVVSGGPGTGKSTIAAAIVALLIDRGLAAPDRIALAAPTGKAAARLQEAVRGRHRDLASRVPALKGYEAQATTVHRWLHSRARDRRPIDALVLDESSMVDVTLMARVLAALPGAARLVLLGDASQLASVQPGSVFADVCRAGLGAGALRGADETAPTARAGVGAGTDGSSGDGRSSGAGGVNGDGGSAGGGTGGGDSATAGPGARVDVAARTEADRSTSAESSPLAPCVVELVHNWRFDAAGGIGRLAAAVVRGDGGAAAAALRDPSDAATELRSLADAGHFERLATSFADEHFAPALRVMQSRPTVLEPDAGTASLSAFRVLCAHRIGAFGAERFNRLVERRLRGLGLVPPDDDFYPGRPILVTRNDPRTGLSNGDTGVVVCDEDRGTMVWFPELKGAEGQPRLVAAVRLPPHESFFAVTVHRAQGSEYDEVAVVLGPAESRVATRELLYTAVTRARRRVVVYGSEESVGAAVGRATERFSGLSDALGTQALPAAVA